MTAEGKTAPEAPAVAVEDEAALAEALADMVEDTVV